MKAILSRLRQISWLLLKIFSLASSKTERSAPYSINMSIAVSSVSADKESI